MAADALQVGIGFSLTGTVTTGSGTTTSGSTFLIAVSWEAAVSVSTVTDSKGNTYTALGSSNQPDSMGGTCRIYACVNGTGGAGHTATVTFSGNAFAVAHLIECPGVDTTSPVDRVVQAAGVSGSGGSSSTVNTGTRTTANQVIVAMAMLNNRSTGTYASSTMTMISSEADLSYWTSGIAKTVVTNTTDFACTFTCGNNTGAGGLWAVTLKEATGGGGGSQNQHTDSARRRNRPGRGPLSYGRWFVRDRKDQGSTAGVQTYAVAVAEGVTTAEAVAAAMAAGAAGAESVAASEAVSAAGVFVGALAEAAAGGDAVAAAMLLVAAISNPATAAESLAAGLAAGAALSESITGTDGQAASLQAGAAVTEPAAATETVTTGPVLTSVLTESVSLAEALAVFSQLIAALSESVAPADAPTGTKIGGASVTELVSAGEQTSTGPVVTGAIAETVAAAEAIAVAANLLASVLEAGTASEAIATAMQMGALLTEPATAADGITSGTATTHNVNVVEVVAALETLVAALVSGGFNPSAPLAARREAATYLANLQTAVRGRNINRGNR